MLAEIIRENMLISKSVKSFMSPVADKVSELIDLLEKESNGEFEKCCTRKKILKGQYLLRQEELTNFIWYLETGIAHVFLERDKMILTQSFIFPHVFIDNFPSTIGGISSPKNIRLLTDAYIIEIDNEKLMKIDAIRDLSNYVKSFLTILYITEMRERIFQFQFLNAKERYAVMIEQRPQMVKEIPSIYLADYLGISPETLSRIRTKNHLSKIFNQQSIFDFVFDKLKNKKRCINGVGPSRKA